MLNSIHYPSPRSRLFSDADGSCFNLGFLSFPFQHLMFMPPLTLNPRLHPIDFLMGDAFGKSENISVRQDTLLSTCHQCGLHLIDRLQTFYSQWRIVLLCRECFGRIRSGQMCSYCFSLFTVSENSILDCLLCFRRVHRACVPLHHRNFSHSQLDAGKFFCMDCCPIPKLQGKDIKTSGCSASHTTFRVPLRDSVSGVKCILEKKVALRAKPKGDVANGKMVEKEFGVINRREFGDKMALHHQPINESDKISRSLLPGKEQCSFDAVLRTTDSDSCVHHSKVEDGNGKKSVPEDSLDTSFSLFSTVCPKDLILKETETSIKFPDSIDDCCNTNSKTLPCHRLNNWFNNGKPDDCDDEGSPKLQRKSIEAGLEWSTKKYSRKRWISGEGSPKLQRKSIEVGLEWSTKKYFRKRWISGRVNQMNSQSVMSNGQLCEPRNLDTIVCRTDSPKNISLQEKDGSLRFPDSMYAGSNVVSASLPCHGMNTFSNSTMPLINCKFGDGAGSSTTQQSSIRTRYSHRKLNKYYRKRWGSGGIGQGKTESILTNGPLFKQNGEGNAAFSGDFFLKEQSTIKFPDSSDNGSNAACALLPSYSLNEWSHRSVPETKNMFDNVGVVGNVDEPSKMQRTSKAIGCRPMKKYVRKHRGSGRIMQKGILNEI